MNTHIKQIFLCQCSTYEACFSGLAVIIYSYIEKVNTKTSEHQFNL